MKWLLVGAGLFAAGFAWGRWHKAPGPEFTYFWEGVR